jgi:hypothetical protein
MPRRKREWLPTEEPEGFASISLELIECGRFSDGKPIKNG